MKTTNHCISKGAFRVPNTDTQDTLSLHGLSSLIKLNPVKPQRDKFPPYTQAILDPMIDLLSGAQNLAKATEVSCDCGTDKQTDLVRSVPISFGLTRLTREGSMYEMRNSPARPVPWVLRLRHLSNEHHLLSLPSLSR